MTSRYRIAEDEACAVYTMVELGRYVHIGYSQTPHKMISRRIKSAGCDEHQRPIYRRGNVIWFADQKLAKRVHKEMTSALIAAGVERCGANRTSRYKCGLIAVQSIMIDIVERSGIRPISENDIYTAKGLRNARALRHVSQR